MTKDVDWKKLGIGEVAALLSEHLRQRGLDAVLVGGACVSIYSSSEYESLDLDFVSFEETRAIGRVLAELGFHKTEGRHYDHPQSRYYAEFLNPPVAIGREQLTHFRHLRTPFGQIRMLTPTDCVKDRLAAYLHWADRQALQQAAMVAAAQGVSWKSIHAWAAGEGKVADAVVGDLKRALAERKACGKVQARRAGQKGTALSDAETLKRTKGTWSQGDAVAWVRKLRADKLR